MDAPYPHFPQPRPLLTPSRLLAVAFIGISAVSAAWIIREEPALGRVALLSGTPLPTSELALMEAAFDRAKLTDYSIEGGRILVPKHRQSGYMRALVDAQALPKEFGGSLRRALESNSPWQSRTLQEELLRVATQEELSLVLCSMPGIRRASILYDSEERQGVGGGRDKTASVNIETENEAAMSPERMRAIRVLVAASIAGLDPARVAVTDLRSGRVFSGPLDVDPAKKTADPELEARVSYEDHLAAKIRQAIGFVKGAIVDVSVGFDPPAPAGGEPEPTEPKAAPAADDARANAPAEVAPAAAPPRKLAVRTTDGPVRRTLRTVQASVAVPETYFQSILERSAAPLDPRQQVATEDREIERIRDHAMKALPPTDEERRCSVTVTKFPVIETTSLVREASPPEGRSSNGGRSSSGDDAPDAAAGGDEVVSIRLPAEVARLVSRGDGGPVAIPRESLLAATSALFAILACMFWLFGGPSSRSTTTMLVAAACLLPGTVALAEPPSEPVAAAGQPAAVSESPAAATTSSSGSLAAFIERLVGGQSLGVSLSAVLVFGIASLAPAVLLMTTSFVRMSVVLSMLRQGIGTPHLPSNQIVTSLAIFLTALVMWPVWTAVWRDGVEPYSEGRLGLAQAFESGSQPLRRWMTGQIESAGNAETLGFFASRCPSATKAAVTAETVPIEALLPAFLVSELETAFSMGLRLLVPFLVLDVVVGVLVTAAGISSLSPAAVALPLKLLVFVLADGWRLVVQSLLDGFAAAV